MNARAPLCLRGLVGCALLGMLGPAGVLRAQEAALPAEPAPAADAQPAEPTPAATAAPALPDTSGWACRFCTFEGGSRGWLEPAVGYVSEPSFRFGDYTGLEDDGPFFDFGGAWRHRAVDSADFLDVQAERYGLDSRALGIRGGRQGAYAVALGYDAIPHRVARDSRTPFLGEGTLGLPAGWTRGSSTGAMASLDASLHGAWLRQDRERTTLGFAFAPRPSTDLRADYRHEKIRGTGTVGGSFLTLASQLPRPVDQTHDRVDLSAAYHGSQGHGQVALMSSFFGNDADALYWQNPYNGPTPGADAGRMALAPDNQAHRLSLTLGPPPTWPLQLTTHLAVGRLQQDERFLPATANPDEATALPRASLDGRVDTMLATVRASYPLGRVLRLSADVLHDERDNRTPVASYTQVVMDTYTGGVRANVPFSFSRDRWRLSLEKRAGLRLGVGVEEDSRERQLGTRRDTRERTVWGRLGWRPVSRSELRLRYAHAERDGAEFTVVPGAPAPNPLARTLESAERRRDELRADLSLGSARVSGAFNVSYGRSEYPDTRIGRTGDSSFGYGTDWSVQAFDDLSVSVFASRHRNEAEQAGSEAYAQPDWFTERDDRTTVGGLHAAWQAPRDIEVGADYVYTASDGSIAMLSGAGESAFPMLVTRWHDARVYGRYPLRPDLSLRLDLVRERYRAEDWSLDGVGPDTVPNLLALGQGTQSGAVTAAVLSLRYAFGSAAAPPAD